MDFWNVPQETIMSIDWSWKVFVFFGLSGEHKFDYVDLKQNSVNVKSFEFFITVSKKGSQIDLPKQEKFNVYHSTWIQIQLKTSIQFKFTQKCIEFCEFLFFGHLMWITWQFIGENRQIS